MKKNLLTFFVGLVALVISCNTKDSSFAQIEGKNINIQIIRNDQVLFACKNANEVQAFLEQNKAINLAYFEITEAEIPALSQKLYGFISNETLSEFYKKTVSKEFIDANVLQEQLKESLGKYASLYPNAPIPKVYFYFTGFAGKDMLVNDSTLAIGLDYFAGKKASYRPQVYDYQLKKYEPANILPSAFNTLAMKYANIDPKDQTLIADVVFYGKCFAFTKTLLPNTADSLLLGYTTKEIVDLEASQKVVWGHFIDNKLLFETNTFKKSKYTEERPNTPEINPECPGAVGRWLGLKITESYLKNNKVTLAQLMQDVNAQAIFKNSGFKGQQETEE